VSPVFSLPPAFAKSWNCRVRGKLLTPCRLRRAASLAHDPAPLLSPVHLHLLGHRPRRRQSVHFPLGSLRSLCRSGVRLSPQGRTRTALVCDRRRGVPVHGRRRNRRRRERKRRPDHHRLGRVGRRQDGQRQVHHALFRHGRRPQQARKEKGELLATLLRCAASPERED
jgi:hypothetical protein